MVGQRSVCCHVGQAHFFFPLRQFHEIDNLLIVETHPLILADYLEIFQARIFPGLRKIRPFPSQIRFQISHSIPQLLHFLPQLLRFRRPFQAAALVVESHLLDFRFQERDVGRGSGQLRFGGISVFLELGDELNNSCGPGFLSRLLYACGPVYVCVFMCICECI